MCRVLPGGGGNSVLNIALECQGITPRHRSSYQTILHTRSGFICHVRGSPPHQDAGNAHWGRTVSDSVTARANLSTFAKNLLTTGGGFRLGVSFSTKGVIRFG